MAQRRRPPRAGPAERGGRVALVERYPQLGGVCLNVGCIPSKALLHVAEVIDAAKILSSHGVRFGTPEIDLAAVRQWKEGIVSRLARGLTDLAKRRGVEVVRGVGTFRTPTTLSVTHTDGTERALEFTRAIVACGSRPASLPLLPSDPRVLDSTAALRLDCVPPRLLILGGGIIGVEMATIFAALGSRVTIVELADLLLAGTDADLVRPLAKRLRGSCEAIHLGCKVTAVTAEPTALRVQMLDAGGATFADTFDAVLVAVGRRPNSDGIGAAAAGLVCDPQGFLRVDEKLMTNVPHIQAIGDVTGAPMLAHRSTHQGKIAAEIAAGHAVVFDARVIPAVAYTDPEIAWVGLTEAQAKERAQTVELGIYPWAASGRALGMDRSEGLTKLLFEPGTHRLLGAGIVGPHAGDLIGEAALAIELGADAGDLALTIHPHPTLGESLGLAAEVALGTVTDLYLDPRRKRGTSDARDAKAPAVSSG